MILRLPENPVNVARRDAAKVWGADCEDREPGVRNVYTLVGMSPAKIRNVAPCVAQSGSL